MTGVWRLLVDGPGTADWNMAVDAALLARSVENGSEPILRLYWWKPHALSLGVNQNASDSVDWAKLDRDGYGVVRRPTGGRAILHAEELTYSVVAKSPPGSIQEAYRWIAAGLREGLARVGIELQLERSRSRGVSMTSERSSAALQARQPCFSAAGRYELVADGRKVVGSAQLRRKGWMMQHGSILLGREHLNLPRYLLDVDVEKEVSKLDRATVDCSTLAGYQLNREQLLTPFSEGFSEALGIELEEDGLSEIESEIADQLRAERYGNERWIRQGSMACTTMTVTGSND
jgi:lipoate-protein ligase A